MNLTHKAMLVRLTITGWGSAKKDNEITDEVHAFHGAEDDAGSYIKVILPAHVKRAISTARGKLRVIHYSLTMPWGDGGERLLPTEKYDAYLAAVAPAKDHYLEVVQSELLDKWEEIKVEAKQRLNGIFKEADMPSLEALRGMYDARCYFTPIPTQGDWRVKVDDKAAAELKASVEEAYRENLLAANRSLYDRIAETVGRLLVRLENVGKKSKGGQRKSPLRDALLQNVEDMVSLIKAMNVMGDKAMTRLLRKIETKLLPYTADDFREDEAIRQKAIEAAKEIVKAAEDPQEGWGL